MSAALVIVWGVSYGILFNWNPAMVASGALLGFAIGGGQ